MASLILGVLDVAYSDAQGQSGSTKTTGDVAEILESKYHVMQTFYDLRKGRIAQFFEEGMSHALQDLFNGVRVPNYAYEIEQKVDHEFRSFLDRDEMQRLALALGGAPISAAAAAGVSHRFKHPFARKNKARPAFVDTGLYWASFRSTVKF